MLRLLPSYLTLNLSSIYSSTDSVQLVCTIENSDPFLFFNFYILSTTGFVHAHSIILSRIKATNKVKVKVNMSNNNGSDNLPEGYNDSMQIDQNSQGFPGPQPLNNDDNPSQPPYTNQPGHTFDDFMHETRQAPTITLVLLL